ncbi:hypothetical protein JR050_11090 [Bacillus sp. RD4P76]|uniref:Uncharacterized protein n=2 Tax=Bacillus suaedaesalsae TaxID=2810349 RepID=A0ABS2DIA7_9BACI|nr:hypothetical protein [Bacillus suaedaesalsae]
MSALSVLLFINFILLSFLFLYLSKIRKLIGFQLGMNITMMAGGFFSISAGVILIYQYPLKFVYVTIGTTVIGMVIGAIFGSLFDYQTLLTGYINGLMMGVMAPMIGAVAQNNLIFLGFIEVLFISSTILISLSAKRT